MSKHPPTNSAINRFFAGLSEFIFQSRLGVADPPLVDYISGLLLRFSRTDAVHKIRGVRGRPLREVVQMFAEAEHRIGTAKRAIHRHIGDFTLFWAGLYPESLRPRKQVDADRFADYCLHGKRAYLIASSIETDDEEADAPGDVLERIGQQFEMCAYGLREVRREWERRDDETPPKLVVE